MSLTDEWEKSIRYSELDPNEPPFDPEDNFRDELEGPNGLAVFMAVLVSLFGGCALIVYGVELFKNF